MADCSKCRNRCSCSEGMQEMLSANCTKFIGTPTEDRHGHDVKPEPKPLARYLCEYIDHEYSMGHSDDSWYDVVEQALDAYESTENVKIKIEKC